MSSSNQRPAKRGFRSVLQCAMIHYLRFPAAVCTRTPARQLSPEAARKSFDAERALAQETKARALELSRAKPKQPDRSREPDAARLPERGSERDSGRNR